VFLTIHAATRAPRSTDDHNNSDGRPRYPPPHVAHLVLTYAARYEFRLDGSSVWQGRVRSGEYLAEMPELVAVQSGFDSVGLVLAVTLPES
jgi:hypothetical protein